jgi:4-amino-4-deoxy-L-arabinose transferase-like glycosyltransferase
LSGFRAPSRPITWASALDALLSRRGVLVYWVSAAILFGLARFAASRSLSFDEARAVEMAQEFAAGYSARQPPLYDQMSWLVMRLMPAGAAQLTLRFSLVALIGWLTFVAVERATGRERHAAAASLSLGFHYVFGWTFHHWGTHTLLLCAAALWSFVALIDLAERPGPLRAVSCGTGFGVGLMSKFSFPLFLGGLVLATLSMPGFRKVLLSRWMLLAALVAAALCAPYLAWLASVDGDVLGEVRSHMIAPAQTHLARIATGLGRLAWSLVGFMLVWLAALVVLMPRVFDPRVGRDRSPSRAERLALRTTVAAIILAAIGIAAAGATTVAERYMHPLLVLAPVIVFGRAAGIESTDRKLPRVAGLAVLATLALVIYRLCLLHIEELAGKPLATAHRPYQALAQELAVRGYGRGTLLAADVREAGNLRALLPELRVIAYVNSHRATRPPHAGDSRDRCVLIWLLGSPSQPDEARTARPPLLPRDAVEPLAGQPIVIELGGKPESAQGLRWVILDLRPQSPACR